ncbi:MAG: outer membrane beta-barrel protein [Ignavibacteriales bacterium]|nr:outer membrane beta-barrel protein [Ignavibacteriales bacterium]
MKKLFVVMLAVVLASSISFAQDMPTQGSKALFGYYNGGAGLGVRYWLSPNMVLVPAVNFAIDNTTTKATVTGMSDRTDNSTTIGISVGVEMHTMVSSVSPYFLGGLDFTTMSTTTKYSVTSPPANGDVVEDSFSSNPFSLYGGLGFEAFIAKGVSAGLEGRVGIAFGGGKSTRKTQGATDQTSENSTFGLSLSTTAVWLSIYF